MKYLILGIDIPVEQEYDSCITIKYLFKCLINN